MRIHKEGYTTLIVLAVIGILLGYVFSIVVEIVWINILIDACLFAGYLFFVRFFRNPDRPPELDLGAILSPADGLVVRVDEVTEDEYFKDKRIKIAIFMSGNDVHINWSPISGEIKYFKYYPGKHLFARNPKSSKLNERTSIVMETKGGQYSILMRQIAGVMARRVVSYLQAGFSVQQGDEIGFIKLGSRIELFLPKDTEVLVRPGQKVTGRQTQLARITS